MSRRSTGQPTRARPAPPRLPHYLESSRQPLHVLVFLFPAIVFYAVGFVLYLHDPATDSARDIRAHSLLVAFFEAFGAAGAFLPAATLVVTLLAWHVLARQRWLIRPLVLGGMLMEAIAWTLPLLVLGILVSRGMSGLTPAAQVASLFELPWQARLTIAVGAGLYEEFLFRMIGIALLHLVLVDLARLKERTGMIAAIVITAVAFTFYHDIQTAGGGISVAAVATYLAAGLYFGVVYVQRGFGIVVAVHALYDVAVLLLPRSEA